MHKKKEKKKRPHHKDIWKFFQIATSANQAARSKLSLRKCMANCIGYTALYFLITQIKNVN